MDVVSEKLEQNRVWLTEQTWCSVAGIGEDSGQPCIMLFVTPGTNDRTSLVESVRQRLAPAPVVFREVAGGPRLL